MRFPLFLRQFPVRAGFWILGLLSLTFWGLFREKKTAATPSDSLLPLVRLLLQMGVFLLGTALAVALLSTLFAWLWERHIRRRRAETLTFHTVPEAGENGTFQLLRTGALMPFWGTVGATLSFEEDEDAAPVVLRSESFFSWRETARQTATGTLHLRHTKAYKLKAVKLLFRDAFGLLSLSATVPASDIFLKTPEALPGVEIFATPRRALEMTERVDTMQRVEGDLHNARLFSSGDDMRRILWNVYARNRELMVRTPEIFEPYASVLTVFAAFTARFPTTFSAGEEAIETALDFYKNAVWTVFQSLSAKGKNLRFQLAQLPVGSNAPEAIQKAITNAHWDTAEPQPNAKTQLLILSSLTPPEKLSEMLNISTLKRDVILVRLSEAFQHKSSFRFFRRLLFRRAANEETQVLRLRRRMLARQLVQWEETLLQMLKENDQLTAVLPEPVS